jgi:isocitrate dehydrogenase
MIRENTEGEYSGLEHETVGGVVESLKIVTRAKMERISRFAFEYALAYNRNKITVIHKANIQKLGDGLFLKVASEMAKAEYPQIQFQSMIVDNASKDMPALITTEVIVRYATCEPTPTVQWRHCIVTKPLRKHNLQHCLRTCRWAGFGVRHEYRREIRRI